MAADVPTPDRDRELVLYQADYCPFCRRVTGALQALSDRVEVEVRNTMDRDHRDALLALAGTTQIPCLVVDGVPMLESADIVMWLRQYADRQVR